MAREKTVKFSEEELEKLEEARDRIFGNDGVALGRTVDVLCDSEEKPHDELVDASVSEEDLIDDAPVITDQVVGVHHGNYDGRKRGVYPEGLDVNDFVGMMRRFVGKNIQYLQVVGDLNGHAVYRMINEGDTVSLNSMPWDEFIEKTVRVNPDAPGTPSDDPARTVVRTDFDTMRERRKEEIETGCTCLPPDEGCHECGGKSV